MNVTNAIKFLEASSKSWYPAGSIASSKFGYQSVRQHCYQENVRQAESGKLSAHIIEQEEEEHRQLMKFNQEENERVAALRKERLEKEKEELIENIVRIKAEAAQKEAQEKEIALQRIRDIEDLVVKFIEPEHLEKAIEDAINNPVDLNFAIDEEGRVYHGRMTQPHLIEADTLPVLPVKDEGLTNVFH